MAANKECLEALEKVTQFAVDGRLRAVAVAFVFDDGTPGNVVTTEDGGSGSTWNAMIGALCIAKNRVCAVLSGGIVRQ